MRFWLNDSPFPRLLREIREIYATTALAKEPDEVVERPA